MSGNIKGHQLIEIQIFSVIVVSRYDAKYDITVYASSGTRVAYNHC